MGNLIWTITGCLILVNLAVMPITIGLYVKWISKLLDSKLEEIAESLHSIDAGVHN